MVMAHPCEVSCFAGCTTNPADGLFWSPSSGALTASTKNTKTILNNEIDKLFDMDK